jgi:heme/copper-type cytochrome/quinol oxidase subunit 2
MNFIINFWDWIWKHAKQLEIILLFSTVIFSFIALVVSYRAYNSTQEQLLVMREQLRSDKTFEKIRFLSDHYNWTFIQQPIYKDYVRNNKLWITYQEIDIRSFIDEFEYVKTLRDILGYQDKTLWIFYRRILIESCKNKPIMKLAINESKNGFLGLCNIIDQMK